MGILLDGLVVSKIIKEEVKKEVSQMKDDIPCLHTIIVGDDPASQSYVKAKKKACEYVGMDSEIHKLPITTTRMGLESLILELNDKKEATGILVQLPLSGHLNKYDLIDLIDPLKDVDGFTSHNTAQLYRGQDCLEPCTPKGVLALLDFYNLPLENKHVVIVGASEIVGKPLSLMMSEPNGNATVTVCHRYTRDLRSYTLLGDILICAIGHPHFFSEDMVKDDAIVIDVGINRIKTTSQKGYALVGDVDFPRVKDKVSYITPVPGGVGPMTVACLIENTLKAYILQNS